MRMAGSCVRLVVTVVVSGGACCAQTVKVAPARHADNAAPLYSLALAELARLGPQGSLKMPQVRKARPGLVAQGVFILPGGKPVADEPDPERVANLLARTALARSLFAQAATRRRCVFGVVPARQAAARDAALLQLVELVMGSAMVNLSTRPAVSCEDAITVLRFYSHQFQGAGVDKLVEMLPQERQALDVLRDGLEKLALGQNWLARSKRYAAALDDYEARRFQENAIKIIVLDGVKEKVELHRARLRDMHMKVPGGFDQAGMCRRLEHVVKECMDVPDADNLHVTDWLEQVEKRLVVVLPKPAPDASVTDKATYGMAQLIVPRGTRLAQENRRNLALIGVCRGILRARGQRPRRR